MEMDVSPLMSGSKCALVSMRRFTIDPQQLRLWLAIVLVVCGMALLFMGFWAVPRGEIHSSVLIAFGEVMTFVGALIGIDYAARERHG